MHPSTTWQRDIRAQVLVEALLVALLGGGAGRGLGLLGAYGIAAVAVWPTLIRGDTFVVALVFAGAVGLVFGVYPAWMAARLDPLEALRRSGQPYATVAHTLALRPRQAQR